MIKPLKKSTGIALVTVLLIVAIATIAAVSISARLQVDIRRTENLIHSDQAWLHMLAVESWAKGRLFEDAKGVKKVDHLGEDWNNPMESSSVEGGFVTGDIVDQQGLFNLNSLIDQQTQQQAQQQTQQQVNLLNKARFIRLLENLDLNPDLANTVIDWLDKNDMRSGVGGAEDSTYQSLSPPYSTANRPMAHRSELLLINGFTLAYYKKLAPFVTALPVMPSVSEDININTAPKEVLESVLIAITGQKISSMTPQDIDALIVKRESDPFEDQAEINGYLPAAAVVSRNGLGVESHYFRVHSSVTVGKAKVGVASLLHRKQTNGVDIVVLQRMREDIF